MDRVQHCYTRARKLETLSSSHRAVKFWALFGEACYLILSMAGGLMKSSKRLMKPAPALLSIAGAALSNLGSPAAAAGPPLGFSAGPASVVMSTGAMRGYGLLYPDTPLSFLKAPGGGYIAFAGGGGTASVGGGPATTPFGTYEFAGTLDHLSPVNRNGGFPAYSLTKGAFDASPDGADFDRDYAAGGQTFALPGSTELLQVYHGEHRCAPAQGLPAYGGLGLAISRDGGRSFGKIGQVISPHVPMAEFCGSGRQGGFWADGWMIEADADGRRTGAEPTYDYMLFVDHDAVDEPNGGVSIARVAMADLLAAVAAGKPPHFLKYYNPTRAAGPPGRFFTEPGLGGRSTPVAPANVFVGSPGVAYDAARRVFILSCQEEQKRIVLRSADTLFDWSSPSTVFEVDPNDDLRLFYPAMVGLGDDPASVGERFYLYFLERRPRNTEPQLMRITIAAQ